MELEWNSAPKGFNQSYRPLASKAQSVAVKELEDEGFYDEVTDREARVPVIRQRYKEVLERLECEELHK